jgi:Xaa-Pro aminopeptidase
VRDGGLPRFSVEEYARRWAALDALVERERLDGLVLFGSGGGDLGVQYLSGWPATREAWLVYRHGHEPTLFVQFFNHLPNATRTAVVGDVRWGGISSPATVAERLREIGLASGRVGLVGAIAFQHHGVLAAALPDITFVDVTPAFTQIRLIKSDEEIAWIRRAAELSDAALAALEREARPGLPEVELGAIVDEAYLRAGGQNTIHFFGVTPMDDPSVCVPAQRPADRALQAGDVLFVELGAQLWGYSGQVLRTFAIAADPPPLYCDLHRVAEEAFDRVCGVLRDGATAEQVVAAAGVIEAAGYTIYDDLVHGSVGGYLPPILRSRSALHAPVPDFTFRAGMTVVIQPNVITPDERAGVQVGELVQITDSGIERLHGYPRGFRRCG